MITLTAPAAVQELLAGVCEKAEILDAAGKVLGIYTPLAAHEAEMYERAKALFDPVQMERLAVEHHGRGGPWQRFGRICRHGNPTVETE